MFSVSSFFSASINNSPSPSFISSIWALKAPPRVLAFGWIALHSGILAMDNLHSRKKILVNTCPMCLADEELVDHLLLRCRVAQEIWSHVLRLFHCGWVFPNSFLEVFQARDLRCTLVRGRLMWSLSFLAVIWAIWKERNDRCFEGSKCCSAEEMVNKLKHFVASWVSILPQFQGISLEMICRSWREVDGLLLSA